MPEKDSKLLNEVHSSNAPPAAGDVNSSVASPPGSTVDPHNVQELTAFVRCSFQYLLRDLNNVFSCVDSKLAATDSRSIPRHVRSNCAPK